MSTFLINVLYRIFVDFKKRFITFTACQAVTFNIAPYNTSAVIGENGTLACIVTLAQGENVQWKKVCNGINIIMHYYVCIHF